MPPLVRTLVIISIVVAGCLPLLNNQTALAEGPAPSSPGAGISLGSRNATGTNSTDNRPSGLPQLVTVFGSLGAVLAAFFVLAWLMKRGMPKNMGMLPKEVVDVLGRAPLSQRQYVHLMRCGNRLLLVSVSPAGAETLTEITDPIEVDRLSGICAQQQGDSVTASFRQVLHQFGRSKSTDADEASEPATEKSKLPSPHSRGTSREGLHA